MKKKILVLGGSSDIGLNLINKLCESNKYKVTMHYNLRKKIVKKNINYLKANFNYLDNVQILKKFESNYDIIINLVGYVTNSNFNNFTASEFTNTTFANSLIPLMIVRKSLNHMIKNKYGRIINTSSVGVKFGGGDNTYLYSLSKHMNEFMPSYFKKISRYNVLYNCIRIGVVDTKFHKKIKNKNLKKRINLIPVKKFVEAKDITDMIIYLIEKNNFISNEIINITGGE